MLWPTVFRYLWSANRLAAIGYSLVAVALAAVFFYKGRQDTDDFNALVLVHYLNVVFLVCAPFLARQVIYRNRRDGAQYFFAALPIAPLRMRLYEQGTFLLIGALPYLLLLPVLLGMLYGAGLWSSGQVLGFLAYQGFFWLVYASFSLCAAMAGRLYGYLLISGLIGCQLYALYSKKQDLGYQGFIHVERVLYKSDPLDAGLILSYGALGLLFYGATLALSHTVNRRGFIWLHAKETGLTRGFFAIFCVAGLLGNFYYAQKFEASQSAFSGLYLTKLSEPSVAYWSSSVQLNQAEIARRQARIALLHREVAAFAQAYRLELPPLHYQHHPGLEQVQALRRDKPADNEDLELEFDFEQLESRFADLERDVLIENLNFLSRGWLAKEDKLIFLRGLAADWSWRHLDKALLDKRLAALLNAPGFYPQSRAGAWLSVYQDNGACLFDALAAGRVAAARAAVPEAEWLGFVHSGLNLDHVWLPFHLLRSLFSLSSSLEQRAWAWPPADPRRTEPAGNAITPPAFELELTEVFPRVFQAGYRLSRLDDSHQEPRMHFYQHGKPGRQVDIAETLTDRLRLPGGEPAPKRLMLKKERVSATLSWYSADLECRLNLPWRYLEL